MLIRKKFRFEAAHRLPSAFSHRCRGIHGHSYVVEVFIEGQMQPDGMVVDFGLLKKEFGSLIDRFDHSLILYTNDKLVLEFKKGNNILILEDLNPRHIITPYEPTAEMMAMHFFWAAHKNKVPGQQWRVQSVRVWETETGWAECDSIQFGVPFEETEWSRAIVEEEW